MKWSEFIKLKPHQLVSMKGQPLLDDCAEIVRQYQRDFPHYKIELSNLELLLRTLSGCHTADDSPAWARQPCQQGIAIPQKRWHWQKGSRQTEQPRNNGELLACLLNHFKGALYGWRNPAVAKSKGAWRRGILQAIDSDLAGGTLELFLFMPWTSFHHGKTMRQVAKEYIETTESQEDLESVRKRIEDRVMRLRAPSRLRVRR